MCTWVSILTHSEAKQSIALKYYHRWRKPLNEQFQWLVAGYARIIARRGILETCVHASVPLLEALSTQRT